MSSVSVTITGWQSGYLVPPAGNGPVLLPALMLTVHPKGDASSQAALAEAVPRCPPHSGQPSCCAMLSPEGKVTNRTHTDGSKASTLGAMVHLLN